MPGEQDFYPDNGNIKDDVSQKTVDSGPGEHQGPPPPPPMPNPAFLEQVRNIIYEDEENRKKENTAMTQQAEDDKLYKDDYAAEQENSNAAKLEEYKATNGNANSSQGRSYTIASMLERFFNKVQHIPIIGDLVNLFKTFNLFLLRLILGKPNLDKLLSQNEAKNAEQNNISQEKEVPDSELHVQEEVKNKEPSIEADKTADNEKTSVKKDNFDLSTLPVITCSDGRECVDLNSIFTYYKDDNALVQQCDCDSLTMITFLKSHSFCVGNLTYTYSKHHDDLAVTGLTDCNYNGSVEIPLQFNLENEQSIPVGGISDHAFACSSINKVVIPSSVRGIGDYAFEESKLQSCVIMGKDIQYMGEGAFQKCTFLQRVKMNILNSNNIRRKGSFIFAGCNNLKEFASVKEGATKDDVNTIINYFDNSDLAGTHIKGGTIDNSPSFVPEQKDNEVPVKKEKQNDKSRSDNEPSR